MPKKASSGVPAKKARWSTAQKSAHKKTAVKGRGTRDDRGERPGKRDRSERSPRWESRDSRSADRPDRAARTDRPARFERADSNDRPRFPRDDRNERPSFNRDDRPRFQRDDRNDRSDRPRFQRDDRNDRSDRPRFQRDDRNDRNERPSFNRDDRPRFQRDDRNDRSDRPRFQRDDRNDRSDRPRFNRDDRNDRSDRPRFNRDDRNDRNERPSFNRDDRPRFNRDDRGDRPERRGPRHAHASVSAHRTERPFRDARSDRHDRHDRTDRFDRAPRDEYVDPEAERMEADHWVKATRRPVSDTEVAVTEDNGFAALGLPEKLVERLARDGITSPFPIQEATIPDALAGRDLLGRGQTGSGKTLAFGLPMITRLAQLNEEQGRPKPRRPRALVMVPTRELAMQVSDALEPLVHVMGLRHKLVAGGLSYTGQIAALDRGLDLLIATPGRLADLMERQAVSLDSIVVTVLDEADHMSEMGFLEAITAILDTTPAGQRMLFSATLDHGIDAIVERYLVDPVTHSTSDAKASVTTMDHHVLLIDPMHKKVITAQIANREGRTVVFCRTKLGADRIAMQLRDEGVMAAALHGGLNQGARNRVLGAFRDGSLRVLVATDVAARGIHVDDVSVVLQVDPPADHKDYLHRSGRTARAGEKGTVVTLALPHQRKTMERQLRDAGVPTTPVKAVPGDDVLLAAGASPTSGIPIPEAEFKALLEGPKKSRHQRPANGQRGGYAGRGRPSGGSRSGGRNFGGERRERRAPQETWGPRRDS